MALAQIAGHAVSFNLPNLLKLYKPEQGKDKVLHYLMYLTLKFKKFSLTQILARTKQANPFLYTYSLKDMKAEEVIDLPY